MPEFPLIADSLLIGMAGAFGLAALTVTLAWRRDARALRRLRRGLRSRAVEAPVPAVHLDAFDPLFEPGEWGPRLETAVTVVGRGDREVLGAASDTETWILGVLALQARRIFEFGTGTGRSAWVLARNSPADAVVTTLTLGPRQLDAYRAEPRDREPATRNARAESLHERFFYTGTPAAAKIRQLFEDSKAFDATPYLDAMDLVFVDGSHARSYVENDSDKAMQMVRPGGVVLWHDYRGPEPPETADVFEALNDLAARRPLVRLADTSLVAWRRPGPQ